METKITKTNGAVSLNFCRGSPLAVTFDQKSPANFFAIIQADLSRIRSESDRAAGARPTNSAPADSVNFCRCTRLVRRVVNSTGFD